MKRLQQTLIDAGVTVKGGADGIFGWNTQVALKQYQKAVGVGQSGEVDEATASALASGKSIAGGPSGLVGLKSGSLGSAVKALQEALIKAGRQRQGWRRRDLRSGDGAGVEVVPDLAGPAGDGSRRRRHGGRAPEPEGTRTARQQHRRLRRVR